VNSSQNDVSDKVVEKTKARALFSISFSENLTVYGTMWKNILEPDRLQIHNQNM
jgi:hypothetical protein